MKTKSRTLRVKDLMVSNPAWIDPDATLQEAAIRMEEVDCGVLPVGKEDDIKGIITDRDIVIRAIAAGKDPRKEHVNKYMTDDVFSCQETDSLEAAIRQMYEHQISRLVVKDDEDEMIGILSLGSVLKNEITPAEMTRIVCEAACSKAA